MTRAHGIGIAQPRGRELAHDHVQPEPAPRADTPRPHERVVDERFERICDTVDIEHVLGRFDGEPAAKYRRLRERLLLDGRQQPVR